MVKTILYIHGFNSAGGGHKAGVIQQMYPACKVLAPTFDYKNPESVKTRIDALMRTRNVQLVVGTSLGGFFALYASMKHHRQAVVINPATKPSRTLQPFIGRQKNFVTHEVYVVTAADIARFERFEDEIMEGLTPDGNLLHFALSTDDELLGDHHCLEDRYPQCSDFNYFDGQGHRFASVKLIKPLLDKALSLA